MSSPAYDDVTVVKFNNRKGGTIYDRINDLTQDIEDGIKSVSLGARATVNTDIMRLKRDSSKAQHPEVEYASLLFNKYVSEMQSGKFPDDGSNVLRDIPVFLYEGSAEQLAGYDATKKNIFWMRSLSALFSFLTCIIMGLVPDIQFAFMHPNSMFSSECGYKVNSGDFSYDAYKLVIAVGSLTFIHSLIFVLYYILPNNDSGQKHIPGLENLFERCIQRSNVTHGVSQTAWFCKEYSKTMELVIDACLLLLALIACIFGAVEVLTKIFF